MATPLRIFAWNPNGIRALLKQPAQIEAFVREQRPDIVFFTETKGSDQRNVVLAVNKALGEIFNRAAPDRQWTFEHSSCAVPGRHGTLAVLAQDRVEVRSVCRGLSLTGASEPEGRVLALELTDKLAPATQMWAIGLYVTNASAGLVRLQYKVEWLAKLQSLIAEIRAAHPNHKVVAIGDMNVAPDARDLCNPSGNLKTAGYTVEERKAWASMMAALDFVDVWRERSPVSPVKSQGHDGVYTFWSTRSKAYERNAGWRIDLAIMPRSQLANVAEAVICKQYLGSDHCPIGVAII